MDCIALLVIFYANYLGDFKFQSRLMALEKSSSFKTLLHHVGIVSATLFLPLFIFFSISSFSLLTGLWAALLFVGCNAIAHALIDWNIWNGYKNSIIKSLGGDKTKIEKFSIDRDYAEDKDFYDTIGYDGYLHYATLLTLYFVFIKFI